MADGLPNVRTCTLSNFAGVPLAFAFLATLDDGSGALTFVANMTAPWRSWTYLYAGISAWWTDASGSSLFAMAVVPTSPTDDTVLQVYNATAPGGDAVLVASVPSPANGDFLGLDWSPALGGLVALVDDDDNSAAALWLVAENGTWALLYQYAPDTLEASGGCELELAADGRHAYAVFYDNARPIANQVVSTVDLVARQEVSRVPVVGSQAGTAIADLARCPGA